MCGLCGEVRFDGKAAGVEAINAMCAVMAPRGPDAQGIEMHDRVALGHRRLSIIDLSERGRQPMTDPALGLSAVFNGCIYNHAELRGELEAKGYSFHSSSDTEVVLKAWHAWGWRAVERFNGMFAIAVTERDSGRLFLARDRLGIKPLYLSELEGGRGMRFASSLPALLAAGGVDTTINRTALHHYLTFHAVVPAPHTIIEGVAKLPAATVAIYEADGRHKQWCYWAPDYSRSAEDQARSREEWAELLHDSLRTAVRRRMVADVPVGVLLSGGVDSSLITGLLVEQGQEDLATFSIGFEAAKGERGDEFLYSDLVAEHFGTRHRQMFIPSDRLMSALPETIAAMSEPMVSYDNVGFDLLSREVSKHVRVVQSGQGADEIFGGYHWYPPLMRANDPAADYARVFFDRDQDEYEAMVRPEYRAERNHSLDFVEAHFAQDGAEQPVDKAMRLDSTVMLVDDPVKRVDNMTMASGLEARVPFLDHELVELAARIPPEHKLRDGGKGILKDVARRVIPEEVIDRPKGYFPVPALKYLDGPYLEMVRDAFASKAAKERGLFQSDYMERLFDDPAGHITPLRGSKLWQAGLLEMWMQAQGI